MEEAGRGASGEEKLVIRGQVSKFHVHENHGVRALIGISIPVPELLNQTERSADPRDLSSPFPPPSIPLTKRRKGVIFLTLATWTPHVRVPRILRGAVHAVQRPGKDPGRGGLPHSPRTAEEVRVGDAPVPQGVLQGHADVLLTDDLLEGDRSPLPGQNGIG